MTTAPLWTAKQISTATDGKTSGNWQAMRVVINSREIIKNDLFIALKGENHDAHRFVEQALADGASGAIVEYIPDNIAADDERLMLVDDSMKALEKLGIAARERISGKVIGITGSVGKTSTKEAMKMACEALGKTHATAGNYNNHIGVPLTLANMPTDTEFAIIEMGMNHAGEIADLTRFARPNIAIITAVEAAHMEFFANVEAIADAKMEITEGLESNGVLLLPADSPYYEYLSSNWGNTKSFGKASGVDYQLIDYGINEHGSIGQIKFNNQNISFILGAIGEHWGNIAASVIGAINELDADINIAAKSLEKFVEPAGRGRMALVKLASGNGSIKLIDDSYNASPASMSAAFTKLSTIGKRHNKRTIALLGDMLELGDDSEQMHILLANKLVDAAIDKTYVAGEMMQLMFEKLPKEMQGKYFTTASEMIGDLDNILQNNDVILVKGSHGSNMYKVAEELSQK